MDLRICSIPDAVSFLLVLMSETNFLEYMHEFMLFCNSLLEYSSKKFITGDAEGGDGNAYIDFLSKLRPSFHLKHARQLS